MQKLCPGWQDLTDLQSEACRREAVIRPLAEQQGPVSREAALQAAGRWPRWLAFKARPARAARMDAPKKRGLAGHLRNDLTAKRLGC